MRIECFFFVFCLNKIKKLLRCTHIFRISISFFEKKMSLLACVLFGAMYGGRFGICSTFFAMNRCPFMIRLIFQGLIALIFAILGGFVGLSVYSVICYFSTDPPTPFAWLCVTMAFIILHLFEKS